ERDVVAVLDAAPGRDHGRGSRRLDRRPRPRADVDSRMALEPAGPRRRTRAELRVDRPVERPAERQRIDELAGVLDRLLQLAQPRALLGDARLEEIELLPRREIRVRVVV